MDGFLDGHPDWLRNRVFEHFSCWELLPQGPRLRILGFLDPEDLGSVSVLNRRFQDDCLHPSLPQERTAVIRIPEDCPHEDRGRRVGERLIAMGGAATPNGRRKFHKFPRLRIVDPHEDVRHPGNFYSPGGAKVPEITALVWSGEEPARPPGAYPRSGTNLRIHPVIYGIAMMLPNLREATFSHASAVSGDALLCLSQWCLRLEKVTWHKHWGCLSLDGKELLGPEIRELYMDDAYLRDDRGDWLLFWNICETLERVSIRGARRGPVRDFRGFLLQGGRGSEQEVTQEMLIGFVRRAPNLRWFRSDLTPGNIAMLQPDFPGVAFISPAGPFVAAGDGAASGPGSAAPRRGVRPASSLLSPRWGWFRNKPGSAHVARDAAAASRERRSSALPSTAARKRAPAIASCLVSLCRQRRSEASSVRQERRGSFVQEAHQP